MCVHVCVCARETGLEEREKEGGRRDKSLLKYMCLSSRYSVE